MWVTDTHLEVGFDVIKSWGIFRARQRSGE
jgi:hypothetical protein